MKCAEFVKMIPLIISDEVPEEQLDETLMHLLECKDCYDELEIHYILEKGLNDSGNMDGNYIKSLKERIENLKIKRDRFEKIRSLFCFIQISAYTSIGGVIIYILFKYFFK